MELNKIKKDTEELENTNFEVKTIDELYDKTLELGKYVFRIKRGLKGKELFILTNTFGITVENNTKIKSMQEMFNTFGENYDLAFSYFEYSINKTNFVPLLINGICQVPELETNVAMMYQLFTHLQIFAVLFMEISQRQLENMQ